MSGNHPVPNRPGKRRTRPRAKLPPGGSKKTVLASTTAASGPARPAWLQGVKNWLWPNAHTRELWVRAQLEQLPAGIRLLDVGAGEQPYRKYCPQVRYAAQDAGQYEPGAAGLQLPGWQYGRLDYRCNAWKIPEKDAYFEAVLCTEVLEHLPFPNETLAEFARLLKPGGVLLLTVPYAALPHMQPQFFYSGFSEEYYRFFLGKLGFEIESVTPNGTTYDYLFQEMVRLGMGFPLGIRALYWLGMALPLAVLKSMALARPGERQLVFGYHIRAHKKPGGKHGKRP
jgi:SAM-dependent methyltransferase